MRASSGKELISVVMPVHNALPHLDAAVRSILDQSHRDFEFVIYDDASTDGSTQRLREWAARDERIRLFEGKHHLGPVGSSSIVVEHSTAALIARMDADDLSSPDRLQRELELLRDHPEVGLVGTLFNIIDAQGRHIRGPDYWRLARKSPFVPLAHGSIMFRRTVFDQVGGYHSGCEYWEDQDLVARMSTAAEVMVIPTALYHLRQWIRPARAPSDAERVENASDLMYQCVALREQGCSYDGLLGTAHSPARVDPRVFIGGGSRLLWAGGRPQLFGRLLTRGRLRFDFASLTALVWTAWATMSPSSLRLFLRLLVKARNARAGAIIHNRAPMRWSPPVAATKPDLLDR
jgi:Glycosyl transferase family 2